MAIELKIESNIAACKTFLDKAERSLLMKAIKRAINRSVKILEIESVRELRKKRAIKAKDIRLQWLKTEKKFKGLDARNYEATLWVKDRKIPLIDLVRGSKLPHKQIGIPVGKRKKLRATIAPGKSQVIKGGFIAKGPKSKGQFNVFRRETTHKGPMVKQSLPSLHLYFMLNGFRQPLETLVGKRMQKEFIDAYAYLLDQAAKKTAEP